MNQWTLGVRRWALGVGKREASVALSAYTLHPGQGRGKREEGTDRLPNAKRPTPNARRRQPGFTLIEMIVATLLLAIGVTGAMIALGTATRASAFAQEMETAALLAQRQFTQIQLQAQSSQSLSNGTQQGDFSPDQPDYHWSEDVEPGNYTNLYQVNLTISWGAATSPHTRIFTTYMNVGQPQNSSGTSTTTTGTGGQTGAQNGG